MSIYATVHISGMNFFWTTAVEASLLPLGDNRKDDTVSFMCKIVIGEGSKRDRAIPSVWGVGVGVVDV